MRAYLIRRTLLVIPTLFILSIIVFLLVRFIPGDVIDAMQEEYAFTAGEIDREALERKLGLDQPIPVQYARWLGDIVLHGSLGQSLLGRFSVNEKIAGRLPVTIQLGVTAMVMPRSRSMWAIESGPVLHRTSPTAPNGTILPVGTAIGMAATS